MNKAIFIDKDGTLIPDIPYNINPELIKLSERSVEALQQLQEAGYLLVIISNQAGVAKGYFEEAALRNVKNKIEQLLSEQDILLSGFYYCPHHTEGVVAEYSIACSCRKPMSGLIEKAAEELNIDLNASWMMGDILNDVEAGNRAGCKTILIDNGNETEWVMSEQRTPAYSVKNINEAAQKILNHKPQERKHYDQLERL